MSKDPLLIQITDLIEFFILSILLVFVIVYLDTNIFLFLLSIFLDFIFGLLLFFFFYFDDEEACDYSHMTYHMM